MKLLLNTAMALEKALLERNLRQAAIRISARAPAYFGPLPARHCDDMT